MTALARTRMASPGWGPGWPTGATGRVVTVVCGASGLRLPNRVEIAPLVAGLVTDLEASRGRPFRRDWSWGYANRSIAGTLIASNHSRATADDLDAPENPMLSAAEHARPHPLRKRIAGRLLRTTMPDDVAEIARRWGFAWGGLYVTRPDPMHFEFDRTPLGAAALIADIRNLAGRPVPVHPWPFQEDDVNPSDVVDIITREDMPDHYALDAAAHMVLLADGTVQHFGTVPVVA